MKTILLLAVGLAIIVSCAALSCSGCDRQQCEDPGDCRFGKTLDLCECCSVCSKGPGEKCGGRLGIFGSCARNLFCSNDQGEAEPDPIGEFYAVGTCQYLTK